MKKVLLFCLILVTCFLFRVSPILADDEIRSMSFDLKGKGYTQSEFKDNLESGNIIFAPNDKFELQIRIKNNGNRNQTNVRIKATLPPTAFVDMPDFTINQIVPGQEFVQNIVLTIKDKQYVYNALKANTIRFDMNTDVGTQSGDYLTFYTSNGTKAVTTNPESNLPATGTNILLGSGITSILGLIAFRLRKLARGY